MPPPRDLDFWPFDLKVGMGVACDLGYPCAKFRLFRPFGFRVRADVRDIRRTDGRTTDADDRLMPPPLRGGVIIITRALTERKLRWGQNLIRDLNPDFLINPDPDVCRIAPEMYWIHSLVGVSHFAKYRKSQPVTVWEMVRNILKSAMVKKMDKCFGLVEM